MSDSAAPVAFLSYSWTSPEYAARVEQLARDLAQDGIHVILDQWDLKEGHDKHAFMERCVLDETVNRVLILIDPRYVERANRREGGVGTETLIISGEVYAKVSQDKFIPVLMEWSADGQATLPIYLKDRIYIDLSDPDRREEQYERLIRNLHGKPEKVRPSIGRRPAYLDDEAVRLRTGQALPMFKQALLQDRPNQAGYLDEYLDRLSAALAAELDFSVPDTPEQLEVIVSNSIEGFRAYRDEFLQLLELIARYGARAELYDRLHAFFEKAVSVRYAYTQQRWNAEYETEHVAFLAWELFLYAVALLLRGGKFGGVARLLEPYYISSSTHGGALRAFSVIDPSFRLLEEIRQRRLQSRWISAAGQLLRERIPNGIQFESLADADSLLWARSMLGEQEVGNWYPRTVLYRKHVGIHTLPLWTRARGDESYFARLAPALGVADRPDAARKIRRLGDQPYFHVGFISLGRHTLQQMFGTDGSSA